VTKTRGKGAVFLHSDAFTGTTGSVDGDSTAYVMLGHPGKGSWKVQPMAGSSPIDHLATARASQQPIITGKVAGSGDSRKLNFAAKSVPAGNDVTFVEYGKGVAQRIGTTGKAKGKLSFKPALGAAGERKVVAIVSEDGMPRDRIVVDKFAASKPVLLAAPEVKADPKPGKLVATWKGVAGATKYLVTVDLGDGRRLRNLLPSSARTYTAPELRESVTAKVTVQPFDDRGVPGKVGADAATAPAHFVDINF
jgi:hypothetical protein